MKHVSVSVTANGAALAQALVVVNEPGGLLFVETDQLGQAGFTTQLSAPEVQLLVVPAAGFWPRYAFGVTADGGTWRVEIDLDQLPGRDRCWWYDVIGRDGSHEAGPIRIGVIDTGVGPHPGLQHVTNLGAVSGYVAGAVVEDPLVTVPSAGLDVTKHGTHVCGIIGHIPADANHPVGVARSAQLFSIRAFQAQPIESIGPSEPVADAEDVAEAIHILSSDVECDIINLSLGGPRVLFSWAAR